MAVRIDLHIHSKFSGDSSMEPGDILKTARHRGLEGVAVTDHGTIRGGVAASKINKDPSFTVITGAEIRTDKGEVIGYFLNEEIKSRVFIDVVEEMRGQDALISLPHPFDAFRLNKIKDAQEAVEHIDSVEVFNSRCILDSSNNKALEFSQDNSLSVTAGSDAHVPDEIGSAGVILNGSDIRKELFSNKEYFGDKNSFYTHAKGSLQNLLKRF